MAIVYYTFNQVNRAATFTSEVTATAASGTLTVAINSKSEVYTATASDTIETVATNMVAQLQNSVIPEFADVTWSNPEDAIIYGVGNADGQTISVSFTSASGVTVSNTSTSPTSSANLADVLNYSTGALPTNGDTLIIENNGGSILWGLNALSALEVNIIRRASHTGQIGLPDTNANGYPEYRPTHLATEGTSLQIEDNQQGFVRLLSTSATAVTYTQTGTSPGSLFGEYVELTGTPASSVVTVNGGGLAFAPLEDQTSVAGTLNVANAAFRSGSNGTFATGYMSNVNGQIAGTYTTLVIDDSASEISVVRAAASTTTTIEAGTLSWNSSGAMGTMTIASEGVLDLTFAPVAVAVTNLIVTDNAQVFDPNGKITKPYTLKLNHTSLSKVTLELGTNNQIQVQVYS